MLIMRHPLHGLSRVTVAFAAVTLAFACAFQGSTAENLRTATADDGWVVIPADHSFTIEAPRGTKFRRDHGIDSYVSGFIGPGFSIEFDYGAYSYDFANERNNPRFQFVTTVVGGRRAIIVSGPGVGSCTTRRMMGLYVNDTFGVDGSWYQLKSGRQLNMQLSEHEADAAKLMMVACFDRDDVAPNIDRILRSVRFGAR
jgi:hypothetical protein